jgi:hypothetical protein
VAARFLADASLNYHIVRACLGIEPTIDFLSAANAGLEGMPDGEVLALAAAGDRILVTHDLITMPWHFGAFLLSGGRSPGVLLVKQHYPVSLVADALVLIWAASEAVEWQNRIVYLSI